MRQLTLVPLLLLCSCLMTFSPRAWVTEEEAFEVDRAALTKVACTTHNGAITVAGGESDKIVVRVTKKAGGHDEADAEDAAQAIEILHKNVEGGLALGWRWREPRSSSWYAVVSFDVMQPRDLPLSVETHNGHVRLTGLLAAVTARSHNGGLTLEDCAGAVDGETHNGHITADVRSAEVGLRTHNGGVDVVLGGDGPVAGAILSHNGNVRLGLPGQRATRLVCTTRNGRVACDRQLERAERGRNFLVADLGAATGRLEVETYNGSIRVE